MRAKFHTVMLPKSFIAINLSQKVPHAFQLVKDSEGKEREERRDEGLAVEHIP